MNNLIIYFDKLLKKMIYRSSRKNKKYRNKDEEENIGICEIITILVLGIYFFPYLYAIYYFLLSGLYQVCSFFVGIILSIDTIMIEKEIKNYSRFHGVIADLTSLKNHETNNILINTMRYNEHCEYGIDQNVTMKVIYDTQMLEDDTILNIQRVLKLFDDVYTVTEIDDNLKDHTLNPTWYRVPNLSRFKYKIGFHKNRIRRIMEVTDIFVKVNTKYGKIFVNFAYVKFDIVGSHNTKFSKEYYNKLNPVVIEKNDQYIESLCLARKPKIKNINKKFASRF